MGTTNTQATIPAASNSSCKGTGQGTRGWLCGRRGFIIAGGVATAATALALDRHWLAGADLVPLIFVLPCAAMMLMMLMGMKGNHGERTNAPMASAQNGTPTTPTRGTKPNRTDDADQAPALPITTERDT